MFPFEARDGYDDALACPYCGSDMLHHYEVSVFCRAREDETPTVVTIADPWEARSGVPGDAVALRCPSDRRGGVSIRFRCENCPQVSELTIAQHKGSTLLGMRPIPRLTPAPQPRNPLKKG